MNKDSYTTRDLAEAAVLLLKNFNLLNINEADGICWFTFENKEKCEELSKNFFYGNVSVNAKSYHEAITRLKSRIFEIKDKNKHGGSFT